MSSSSVSLTRSWLRQNVRSYANPNRVYADIDAVLLRFSSLRPKSDVYTYDDGRTLLLLCIHGVLPISFKGIPYNIPLALWIPRDYPLQPPLPYLVPTGDMLIKPSGYVDVSGRCSPEYISHWQRKSEGCHIIALLEALQAQFSLEPPLFAKPKTLKTADSSLPPHRPPLPPKPRSSSSHPVTHGQPSVDQAAPSPITLSLIHPLDTAPSAPVNATPSMQPDAPVAQPLDQGPLPTTVTNLLDEDAPIVQQVQQVPPRPPNPELLQLHSHVHHKIKSDISSLSQGIASDTERWRALQADLLAGEPAIRDEMARLEAVRDVCLAVNSRLHDSVGRAESNIAQLRRRGDPDIDQMVCAPTIVHNQLINLTAEDNAIEDTIYQLHRALNAGRIDLDRFLRTTRVLAEEQFMKRALIEKITIGLPKNQSGGPIWS